MKKSMSLLDVRPLIWNQRWKQMYVGKEEQEQILCMRSQRGSQKPAGLREYLPSHLLFTFQITRLALVGGTNAENMIRRMLSATMANRVACIFNWAGKGPKRAFKDTLMQDCMFAAARQFDQQVDRIAVQGCTAEVAALRTGEEWRGTKKRQRLRTIKDKCYCNVLIIGLIRVNVHNSLRC
ncbi:unnamed protein product [Arctogadus glacialis]